MTITLTDDLEELINEKVKSGDYESADQVVGAGLRLLRAKDEGIEALRQEILLGFEDLRGGRFTSCDSDADLGAFSDEIIKQAQERRDSR